MQHRNTGAIHTAERIMLRTYAISGSAVAIAAAVREGLIQADEIQQMLDVIAKDLRSEADLLLSQLIGAGSATD